MKTKKNFSPIVSHYKSFFADTFLKFISKNRNIENSFYLNKSKNKYMFQLSQYPVEQISQNFQKKFNGFKERSIPLEI